MKIQKLYTLISWDLVFWGPPEGADRSVMGRYIEIPKGAVVKFYLGAKRIFFDRKSPKMVDFRVGPIFGHFENWHFENKKKDGDLRRARIEPKLDVI